jgi:hypothetical protein
MRRNRKPHAVLVLLITLGAAGLSSCGGGEAVDKAKEAAQTAEAITKANEQVGDGGVISTLDPEIDKVIGTMLEQGMGQRGKKTKGRGKGRFINLYQVGGKGVEIDVWWGRPDEGAKAATIAFGQSSEWMTPMITKGFTDSADAVYTVTETATTKELFSWDRWTPTEKSQLLMMFSASTDGGLQESTFDFDPTDVDFNKKIVLPAADAGMVRMEWRSFEPALDGTNESLRAIRQGTKCLTNGSGIAGPDGNQIDGASIQVPVGTELALSSGWCNEGTENVATVKVPATSGRAILIAYQAPDGPKLLIEPAP